MDRCGAVHSKPQKSRVKQRAEPQEIGGSVSVSACRTANKTEGSVQIVHITCMEKKEKKGVEFLFLSFLIVGARQLAQVFKFKSKYRLKLF